MNSLHPPPTADSSSSGRIPWTSDFHLDPTGMIPMWGILRPATAVRSTRGSGDSSPWQQAVIYFPHGSGKKKPPCVALQLDNPPPCIHIEIRSRCPTVMSSLCCCSLTLQPGLLVATIASAASEVYLSRLSGSRTFPEQHTLWHACRVQHAHSLTGFL